MDAPATDRPPRFDQEDFRSFDSERLPNTRRTSIIQSRRPFDQEDFSTLLCAFALIQFINNASTVVKGPTWNLE